MKKLFLERNKLFMQGLLLNDLTTLTIASFHGFSNEFKFQKVFLHF